MAMVMFDFLGNSLNCHNFVHLRCYSTLIYLQLVCSVRVGLPEVELLGLDWARDFLVSWFHRCC